METVSHSGQNLKKYLILYRTATGRKHIKIIKAKDISDATMQGIKFCSKYGRSFYAIDGCVSC